MIEFTDNDSSYLKWLDKNPTGLVINSRRQFDGYHVVHRTNCSTISKPKKKDPGEFTERGYIKVCVIKRSDIDVWLDDKGYPSNDTIIPCQKCLPEL